MLHLHGEKRTPADQRTCYYLMRAVRLDRQTRPALVPIRDKSRSPLTSKNPPKPHDCASAPLAPPHKPPAKSHLIMRAQRGANSPLPHCGRLVGRSSLPGWAATRGEFAPPSLRLEGGDLEPCRERSNEGRIRPSLIAAIIRSRSPWIGWVQRGANSPLPHCGSRTAERGVRRSIATRGEFAPPSLRPLRELAACCGAPNNEGRIRPSLIAAIALGASQVITRLQRGANSPLPHCGLRYN